LFVSVRIDSVAAVKQVSVLKLNLMEVALGCYSYCFHSGEKLGWNYGEKRIMAWL